MSIFRNGNDKAVKLNICGLTKETDIMVCTIVKIDAAGFWVENKTSAPKTDKLSLSEARQLIGKVHKPLNSVILIKKAEMGEIDHIIRLLQPDAIQLQEEYIPLETVKSLAEKYSHVEFIKTVYIRPDLPVQKIKKQIDSFSNYIDAINVDVSLAEMGETLNWLVCAELTRYIRKKGKYAIMAGRLDTENIEKAVQIVKPDMVDILTGAYAKNKETQEPIYGRMDRAKMVEFARIIEKMNN